MSKYSGKCDVADWCDGFTDEQLLAMRFYIGRNIVPLKIESQKDLAPYYAHLVSAASGQVVRISEESFVDSEEREHLTWRLENVKKYYRKCKRMKIPYDMDEAVKQSSFFTSSDIDREIAKRVGEQGNKATIDGLRLPLQEHNRKKLFTEMVRLGWEKERAAFWIWNDFSESLKHCQDKEGDGLSESEGEET